MNLEQLLGSQFAAGEDFTVDDIVAALADKDFMSKEDAKKSISKANKEAADYKKKWRETLETDEAKKVEEREAHEDLLRKYNELVEKTKITETSSKYLEMGMDSKTARKLAEAVIKNDVDKIVSIQAEFTKSMKDEIETSKLDNTPKPVGNGNSQTMTLEKFRGLSLQERAKFSQEHPQEYRELYQSNN